MRKIIYSRTLKCFAVLLVIFYVSVGAYTATDAMMRYNKETERVYGFEGSFQDSRYLSALLSAPEATVESIYRQYYDDLHEADTPDLTFEESLREALKNLWCSDKVNYYVSVNETVFTNCGSENGDDLTDMEFYFKSTVDKKGLLSWVSSARNDFSCLDSEIIGKAGDEVTVIAAINPVYVEGARIAWERQENLFFEALYQTALVTILSVALFIYLICVAGKNSRGETTGCWIDLMWTEVHLIVLISAIIVGAALWIVLIEDGYYFSHRLWSISALSIAAVTGAIVLTSSLSLVRKIKTRNFLNTSGIVILCKWLGKWARRLVKAMIHSGKSLKKSLSRTLFKKTGAIFCTLLLFYTAAVGFCGILSALSPLGILLGLVAFLAGCFFLAYRGADLDAIKDGAKRIREGELGYKIEALKCDDLKSTARDINEIAEGLERSVAERTKAERMKTELITNVSHDLKTPLTSIITYTELLSKLEGLPEEAKDYIGVIAKKSDRLEKLTRDLFDISKAQSGNEEVILERLDTALLIQQALGEYDKELKESGLTLCVDLEKDLYIFADGRKLSRVLGNLLENILKYTLPQTRVFIRAYSLDDEIQIELKNVSSYPLDFNEEEILGRFVRGDEARSTEGNGLGLAIAKSYTELCGGQFRVLLDGDLFKTVLIFKKISF
ncbi:MAG: HAMP domain-containing histidine kinase [Clostridia bacterium]|nr:HAMP domain-containing histidine kinase [Clostridia bacterium]